MSDEKRQTRLLPFRLRRAGARRHGAGAGPDGAEDFSADPELSALLRAWEAPEHSDAGRARLLADFRAEFGRAPLWRRALTARVRVPVPLAACAALALALLLFTTLKAGSTGAESASTSPAAGATAVRVVEVPVVQERVVMRTVYVEKKERGEARGASTRRDPRAPLAGANKDDGRAGSDERAEPARSPEQMKHAGYYTRVDMNDFQPTDEMKIRVVSRGGVDEK